MDARARILDANANRAREALRVMEDLARFVLGMEGLCAELKQIRHGLREAMAGGTPDAAARLAWRDTPGDVGTAIGTESESRRASLAEVGAAAAKRLGEALRVIEECAKIGDAGAGAGVGVGVGGAVEALRYRAYEAERVLLTALGGGRAPQWGVCVLITESLCSHHSWERVAEQAIEGGADCLQLREKALTDAELLRRARRLVEIARRHTAADGASRPRAAVIINDRPDIALLAGADGVHLGQTDLAVRDIRRIAGAALLVGVSTENLDQARRAAADGADYCGVGPMFPTTTKDKPRLAGPAYLREYLADPAASRMPHLAIGGITADTIGQLAAVGGRGIAVSSAVCAAQRPAEVCRALRQVIAPTHAGDSRVGGG